MKILKAVFGALILNERGRQWALSVLAAAATLAAALLHHWPFTSGLDLTQYPHPTLWQLLLADRFTLGLVRLAFIALGLYVVVSVPALVAASRWLKGFGKEGLTADDAETANKTIAELKKKLDVVTGKFEDATKQVAQLTIERDEAISVARQAVSPKDPDQPAP